MMQQRSTHIDEDQSESERSHSFADCIHAVAEIVESLHWEVVDAVWMPD